MHFHSRPGHPTATMRVRPSGHTGQVSWQQSGAATVLTDPNQLDYIKTLFVFRQGDEVRKFLSIRPHLIELLEHANSLVRMCFPEGWALLKVLIDPEEVGERSLGIYIVTQLDVPEAVEQFDHLLDQWMDYDPSAIDSELTFNLEFA
jgi:hypothetical protein